MSRRTKIALIAVWSTVALAMTSLLVRCEKQPDHSWPRSREARRDLRTILEAQEIYRRQDYDNDGVLEYATSLNSLFETKPGARDICILDQRYANADDARPNRKPLHGYFFKVLTSGDSNPFPSEKNEIISYMKDGNLVLAHACLAYPAVENDIEGHHSYLINSSGIIYKKHLGPNPIKAAQSINEYHIGPGWEKNDEW